VDLFEKQYSSNQKFEVRKIISYYLIKDRHIKLSKRDRKTFIML